MTFSRFDYFTSGKSFGFSFSKITYQIQFRKNGNYLANRIERQNFESILLKISFIVFLTISTEANLW